MEKNQKPDSDRVQSDRDKSKQRQNQPEQEKQEQSQPLTKEELPDSTNESKGTMGSGQRQDSN